MDFKVLVLMTEVQVGFVSANLAKFSDFVRDAWAFNNRFLTECRTGKKLPFLPALYQLCTK